MSFTQSELKLFTNEELTALFEKHCKGRTPVRRAALVSALCKLAVESDEGEEKQPDSPKGKRKKNQEVAEEKEEKEEKPEKKGKRKKEDPPKEEVKDEAVKPEIVHSFDTLKQIAKAHNMTGRSKAQLLASLEAIGVDVDKEAQALGQLAVVSNDAEAKQSAKKGKRKKKSRDDDDDDDDYENDADAGPKKRGAKKQLVEEEEEEEEEEVKPSKSKKGKAVKSSVPFDSGDLLSATAAELREYGAQVGAASKKKDELLKELRDMLPKNDRWASSDDDWENIRLPGTNSYGNIDVREGVDSSLVHVDGLRLGPTCRANHIPCVQAVVGFNSYRGRYSPIISGVVIRKKDLIKLNGVLKNKEAKKERGEVRKEQKLMIPKKKRAWSFADLPPEQQKNLRDFSELPRDCWIIIFKFCWAGDIVNCGRVSKGLYQVSINEQLWRAKLYADFEVCDELKAMPARQAYLKLASSNHPGCRPKFPGLSLVEVYHERAQKWLDESNKVDRQLALEEACKKIGVQPHHSSKLVPSFIAGTAGCRTAGEVAAILKGVATLFNTGGHQAYSRLHDTLHSELHVIKFRHMVTWKGALQIWENSHNSEMHRSYGSRYGYGSDSDVECYNCGGYGHYARDCYY